MKTPSSLYRHPLDLEKIRDLTQECLEKALPGDRRARVFFRADDVAAPGSQTSRLLDIFIKEQAPLCLALVPSWLTGPRWESLTRTAGEAPHLWCWHQHGWRHVNHETSGKKQEFGPSRSPEAIRRDLESGRNRLTEICGSDFFTFFTPPWNRCSSITLEMLVELGYTGVSRSNGKKAPAPKCLQEYSINVDLHTRKEADPIESTQALFNELESSLSGGLCGIMLHHQRMNETAFGVLEILLRELSACPGIELGNFRDLTSLHILCT